LVVFQELGALKERIPGKEQNGRAFLTLLMAFSHGT
jgi:hypothetical protein